MSLVREVAPGVQLGLRHRPDHTLEPGFYVRAVDGKPIPPGGELVFLGAEGRDGRRKIRGGFANASGSRRSAGSSGEGPRAAGDGPAQVATPAYRDGYDRIFGKQKVGQA